MKILELLFISIIKVYQKLSSGLPRTCRFYPTCSRYMVEAVEKRGLICGIFCGIKRLMKCHPLNPGGYDPI